jgi:glycosidase
VIRARLRTRQRAAQRGPAAQRFIVNRALKAAAFAAAITIGAFAAAVSTAVADAAKQAVAPPRGAALRALAQPPVRTSIASERIYFVMTDRYANGNTANDALPGYDPDDPGYFHGGDFAGLTGGCTDARRGLARLKDLGFTAIWVTPPFVNKPVQGDSAGYHGYWGLDFTRVDPHLGGDEEFAVFVACAHSLGLKVFLDVVVNHTADVIQLSSSQYVGPPAPAHVPSVPAEERNVKAPAWLNDSSNYHNRGNIDFNSCNARCFELGDFFGLDDIATEQADVRDGLVAVFADWIRRYRIDGFRIDTARHVERSFFHAWVPRILAAAREAGVPSFELFGEAFIGDAVELSTFVRDRGLPNVLDFPLQDALARFAGGSAGANGIADRLRDDDYFARPNGVVHTPPTFIGNHDIGRAALMIRSLGVGAAGPLLDRVRLGYSLLYLLRGAPVVYYGDEFGIIGRGGDKAARHDLFPTRVAEWQTEERVGSAPIGSGSSFDVVGHPLGEHLRALGALRAAHPALATGATIVRRADRNVLVVSRIDTVGRREYVAAFNAGTAEVRVAVTTATGSSQWTSLLGDARASSGAGGALTVELPPLAAVLLRADEQLAPRRPTRPVLRVARDGLSDLWRVSVIGTQPGSVSFAVKRGRGAWSRLAADDSPPYRAFLDPTKFRNRERVHLVAIRRSLGGATATSRVLPFTVRR